MDTFALTEKYHNFDGRIITEESILINGKEIPVKAQWDCGATFSSISKEFVQKLGLKSVKQQKVDTSSDSTIKNAYAIDIVIHHALCIPTIASEADNIHSTGIDLLIGMDVIRFGDFAISTYDGVTCFSFRQPSQGLIDFTK